MTDALDNLESVLVRRAAMNRGQPPVTSWDVLCTKGISYQGYGLDELLWRLLFQEARGRCDQCGAGDCTHESARLFLYDIVRLTEPGTT